MQTTSTRRRAPDSGQAVVEMALIFPVLLILIVGILEIGRAWNVRQVVTDAARDGARQAIVQNSLITQDSVKATISGALTRAAIPLGIATITFDESPPPAGHWRETGATQTVAVSIRYRLAYLGPLVKGAIGSDTITIASQITMRNE